MWRDAYLSILRDKLNTLRRAREIGQTWLMVNGRQVNPSRMSDRQIDALARREAERITNMAINQENEAKRKAGRPDEVTCESIV